MKTDKSLKVDSEPTRIGPLVRIALSFLGMLAGYFALFILMIIVALRGRAELSIYDLQGPESVMLFALHGTLIYSYFSLAGWVAVGPLIAVFVPASSAARMHPLVALILGALLGLGAMLTIFVLFFRFVIGFSVESIPFRQAGPGWSWIISVVVASPSFLVYTRLLRHFGLRGHLIRISGSVLPHESA